MNTITCKKFTVYRDYGHGIVGVAGDNGVAGVEGVPTLKWLWKEYIQNNHQDYWLKKFSPPTNDIFQNE